MAAVSTGTPIPPILWPVAGSYHVSRRVPRALRVTTARTWDERPTRSGRPTGFARLTSAPLEASLTCTRVVGLDAGNPPFATVVAGRYAIRPLLTARPTAGPVWGREAFWPAVTRSIPPPATFFLHDPPELQASGSTYSTSTPEYASVVPSPVMPPSHQPVPPACASRSTSCSLPPICADMTKSEPFSCSVQSAAEASEAIARCTTPFERAQWHVMLVFC